MCGYNFGAKRYERVQKGFWFSVIVSTTLLLVIGVLLYLFAPEIVRVFRDDPEIVEIGAKALRYQVFAIPFLGWIVITNMFLQNIRRVVPATIVAMARQGIVFIPVLFLFVHLLGLTGLELTQPVSDFVTFLISVPFDVQVLMGLGQED